MNISLIQPGTRAYIGTADVHRYHWYATVDGRLVRGGVALRGAKKTPHDAQLCLGETEARYVGAYTINYIQLPNPRELRTAIARVWERAA